MQLFIQFPDFSNTSALDKYMEKHLRSLQTRLEARYNNPVITLRGAVMGRTPDRKPKKFQAEILVKVPRSKAPFVVKKTAEDFRSALALAVDAMETMIRRESEKAERSRKTVGKSLYPVRRIKESSVLPKKAKSRNTK